MTSLDIFAFKQSIINFNNQSELPAEVRRMVIKEVYEEVQKESLLEIQKQIGEEENGSTEVE